MDNQLLAQMNQRMDEHYTCLCGQIDELTEVARTMQATLVARMDAHEDYHRKNEHRWGLIRLAGRYPFRLAGLTFLMGWVLLASAPESFNWLGRLTRHMIGALFGAG